MSDNPYRLSIDQIRNYLPHRQPFLLVDRILEIHPVGDLGDATANSGKIGIKVVGQKNISYGEACFAGHFPQFSIYPGVWIVETMAQVASFAVYPYIGPGSKNESAGFECILLGVDAARFRKPVVPGDTLILKLEVIKCRGKLWAFKGEAFVEGELVAEAELLANLILKGKSA